MAKKNKKPDSVAEALIVKEMSSSVPVESEKAKQESVIDFPSVLENRRPHMWALLSMAASAADGMVGWGVDVQARDLQLRNFVNTESVLMSAVYSVSARNASFAWEIVPADPREDAKYTRRAVKRMLDGAENGAGWNRFMFKTCEALYTQDNGAFWELVRRENNASAPVVGLNTLDPSHCTRTGDPDFPVIYTDRKGALHRLASWQVVTLEEWPSSVEEMYGAQHCAVTRALRMAQILKSIFIYKDEKVSGRNPRALDFVSGVGIQEIEDAKKLADELANNQGFSRFSPHILISGIDPASPVATARIDLASLPDNFAFDEEMKWYISILAMAFGVDYQEFAPLPTASMGSGAQSEILHLKTHGKGPATIMGLIEHIMRNYVVPSNVKFRYLDHDARTEAQTATAMYTRGRDRALRLQAGELDEIAARYLAVEQGDLPEWVAEDMDARGVEADPPTNLPPTQQPAQGQSNTPQPNNSQFGPNQVSGAQQGGLQKAGDGFINGGMRGIKPESDPVKITDSDIEQQRRELAAVLGG